MRLKEIASECECCRELGFEDGREGNGLEERRVRGEGDKKGRGQPSLGFVWNSAVQNTALGRCGIL